MKKSHLKDLFRIILNNMTNVMFLRFNRAFDDVLLSLNHVKKIKNPFATPILVFWIFSVLPGAFGFRYLHFDPVFRFPALPLEHSCDGNWKFQRSA